VLDGAEVGDGFSEGFALLGVLNRFGEHGLRTADAGGAELEAPEVEDVEGDDVAAADLAQNVLHRDLDVVEEDGRGRASVDAHLALFGAGLDAVEGALDEEGGELLPVDLGEDGVDVGPAAVRDPHLLAVEDVVFFIL